MILEKYQKIKFLLNSKELNKFKLVLVFVFISAVVDVIGIAFIVPILSIVSNKNLIFENIYLNNLYSYFQFQNLNNFITVLIICNIIFVILGQVMKTTSVYLQIKFIFDLEKNLGLRLIKNYVSKSYDWYDNKDYSELSKNILSEVSEIINQSFLPFIFLVSNFVAVSIYVFVMLLINLKVSLISIAVFFFLYFFIYKIIVEKLKIQGKNRKNANYERYKSVTEIFRFIKEIKLFKNSEEFISKFTTPADVFANAQIYSRFSGLAPRFILEGVCFLLILSLVLYQLNIKSDLNLISVLTFLAVFGIKLLPLLQQIYINYNNLSYSSVVFDYIIDEFGNENKLVNYKRLKFDFKRLILKNVTYSYNGIKVIKDFSFNFDLNKKYVIVGSSGSGKSTILDLILGLRIPDNGEIYLDKNALSDVTNTWQDSLGYVSQSLSLINGSIYQNIAFTNDERYIDRTKIEFLCNLVMLDEYISTLNNGYNFIINGSNINMSGGQMQKMSIARALYKDPRLLILDEATSALDVKSESLVLKNIFSYVKDCCVISVSHRPETMLQSDLVLLLDKGKLITYGKYEDLEKSSDVFKQLLRIK